jgi:hypothetical protein
MNPCPRLPVIVFISLTGVNLIFNEHLLQKLKILADTTPA